MWGSYRAEDLRDFILNGELLEETGGDVLPYNPQVAAAIAEQWKKA